MRIYNLTDQATPVLEQHKLVNMPIIVGKYNIAPGEFVEVPAGNDLLSRLKFPLTVGAVAVDVLPPDYLKRRGSEDIKTGILASAPVQVGPVASLEEPEELKESKELKEPKVPFKAKKR